MLHELDILEARRIAALAAEARKVRDRLLEKVPEADLGEPTPARGKHTPAHNLMLDDLLAAEPEFAALREAITSCTRDIREKLWVVTQIGRDELAPADWEAAIAEASAMTDDDIVSGLLGEPDLHNDLSKGLYALGAATLPGDAG
ncbi:MAG TPA: DUF3775 domain-containing protein [Acetobacteraceae bacterium]|nr:DUF3775 domain-containing protein [Acetobacteraceae bacterium]